MYLTGLAGRDSVFTLASPMFVCALLYGACGSGNSRIVEYLPDALEIFRRIDADRVEARFEGLDSDAVLERAQLLERLGALQLRRREAREAQQAVAAVHVQPDVAPGGSACVGVADVGNRRAREIQREAVAIDDHLRDVRVV